MQIHKIHLKSLESTDRTIRSTVGGCPILAAGQSWPTCKICQARMVFFLQMDLKPEFGLPFEPESHLLVFMCPKHNEIPAEFNAEKLPPEFWLRSDGHYCLLLNRPAKGEQIETPDPYLQAAEMFFEPAQDSVETVDLRSGSFQFGSQGFKVGGIPSWAQRPEWHKCNCGADLRFVCQIPNNFGFAKITSAVSQPDSFSFDDYCLFLGNEVYLFACVAQCHPMAVWAVVQN